MLSPTLVHFMPTTLTMMPINPSSTDTTMRARHVWMWTGNRRRRRWGGADRTDGSERERFRMATSQQLLPTVMFSCRVNWNTDQIQNKVLQQILNLAVSLLFTCFPPNSCIHSLIETPRNVPKLLFLSSKTLKTSTVLISLMLLHFCLLILMFFPHRLQHTHN